MPEVFFMRCGSCDRETSCSDAIMWVTMSDGEVKPVWHPGEVRRVEQMTGQPFNEVLEADRLQYSVALVCRRCGAVEHYRDDEHPTLRRPESERMLGPLTPEQVSLVECSNCGHFDLERLRTFVPRAREEGFRFLCAECGSRQAALTGTGRS